MVVLVAVVWRLGGLGVGIVGWVCLGGLRSLSGFG